jgi:hypothetical protein
MDAANITKKNRKEFKIGGSADAGILPLSEPDTPIVKGRPIENNNGKRTTE